MDKTALYRYRFSESDLSARQRLWRVLIDGYVGQWIDESDTVLDLGAADCAFINNVQATRRIAVDTNPDVEHAAADGVDTIVGTLQEAGLDAECDVIMASNIFEHLPSVDALLDLLESCRDALRRGGRLIILQPNFRYAAKQFYDHLDHSLPLSHCSLYEALTLVGFEVEKVIPRFLPYSAKQQRFSPDWALRTYLRVPALWRVAGKQMFVVARRSA